VTLSHTPFHRLSGPSDLVTLFALRLHEHREKNDPPAGRSASNAATSAANAELCRSRCAESIKADRIASDRDIHADSRARRARSASSSRRTEIT